MDSQMIIKRMAGYQFQLNEKIVIWLDKKLPAITPRWWDDLVLNNLTPMQRQAVINRNVTELSGLDLASVLNVFNRNWFVLTSKFYVHRKVRDLIRDMRGVRNDWAHITPADVTREKVLHDGKIIMELLEYMDANAQETHSLESFLLDIEDGVEITSTDTRSNNDGPVISEIVNTAKTEDKQPEHNPAVLTIGISSMVSLVTNPSKVGVVMEINGNRYTVFLDGRQQTFYREQIKLVIPEPVSQQIPLSQARGALTAFQIHNPGSSNLYSLNAARIDFVPYQFRPALKMIKADTPRLLVADDVGVGKTIEAGLILKEMEARNDINSVLIICPRPLVAERKWELEMKRFEENFTQLNGSSLLSAISDTDRDGEWPERHAKTVVPYSILNEDTVMGTQSKSSKRKKSKGLNELDPLPHFDLVIVDEAHTIRNANTWAYKGVELFCRNADAVVFLTATPLQNSNKDLYTLLNLLRPDVVIDSDTFNTMAEPNAYVNNLLRIVRNQAEDWQELGKIEISNILSTTWGRNVIQQNPNFAKVFEMLQKDEISREERIDAIAWIESLHSFNSMINRTRRKDIEDFCIRRTETERVDFNSVQRDLYDALVEFESTALAQLHGSRSVRFMMCTVMRQAASCIYGLAPFMKDLVEKRLNQIQQDGEMYEYDYALNSDEENLLYELADEIAELSSKLPENDPKLERMYEVIQQKQKEENNRVIIFSSFRHTLNYIKKNLQKRNIRVGLVDGSVADEDRYALRERFLMDRDEDKAIDVLLFSEVGCEGLDYQFCDTMINYDLPWNPMRIEQRIGRIDRRGQKSETVKIYNMITEGTIDANIYDRCLSKIGVFEDSIGDCSEILGDITDQISKIMFDSELTEEERNLKFEKMADNEVMKVQEMRKLEQEEKSLFGFDLSSYMQTKEVQEAENSWISPQYIQDLVNLFMEDFLGEGEYIRGRGEQKNLRLNADKRRMLFKNLQNTEIANTNAAYKLWQAYLKSEKPLLPVTFDSTYAKDNRNVTFLTQMHPLVIQAANYECQQLPCELGVNIQSDELPTGNYEFLIYAWTYKGLQKHNDVKMIAVCDNEQVQDVIMAAMQYGSDYKLPGGHTTKWDVLENSHYDQWKVAKDEYVVEVSDECEYRRDQLSQSTNQREAIYREQIEKATDERIIRMRQSQLDKLISNYKEQSEKLDEVIAKADIVFDLIVRGVLHVDH